MKYNLMEEVDFAQNQVSQVDAVINGLKDALKEHKKYELFDTSIERLYELQEQMETLVEQIAVALEDKSNEEEDNINDALEDKSVDEVVDILSRFGEVKFVDEKIDDGLIDADDDYLMMRSYDLHTLFHNYYIKLYYGNCTKQVSWVEIGED